MRLNIVKKRGSEQRKSIEKELDLDFNLSGKGKIKYLIANETKEFKKGESKPVSVKEIEIPSEHLVLTSGYARHPIGKVIGVGEAYPKPIEITRTIDDVLFSSGSDGEIKKDDLIGVLILLSIETKFE